MFKGIWEVSFLLYSVFLAFLPYNSAQAQVLVDTASGAVQMIESQDSGMPVGGLGFNFSAGAGRDFDFFAGSIFTPIISKGATTGNWPFLKGDVVNFSLGNNAGIIFSITDPADYVDKNFEQEITGEIPSPSVFPYFNTLNIDWDESESSGALIAAASILDDGPQFNGVAPAPLPISALLFGSGLIGLVGIARRSLFSK